MANAQKSCQTSLDALTTRMSLARRVPPFGYAQVVWRLTQCISHRNCIAMDRSERTFSATLFMLCSIIDDQGRQRILNALF